MTRAVCAKCGAWRSGASCPGPSCGHAPREATDRGGHAVLSSHDGAPEPLEGLGRRIARGQGWVAIHPP